MLIRIGPSPAQIWQGHAKGTPWVGSLFYSTAWLWSFRPTQPPNDRNAPAGIAYGLIGARAAVLGAMFFLAVASIQDW
jgi:hypothetical protein